MFISAFVLLKKIGYLLSTPFPENLGIYNIQMTISKSFRPENKKSTPL